MEALLYIPERYDSRYSLLGAFCAEVGRAARELGVEVNPDAQRAAARAGKDAVPIFLMFNGPARAEVLDQWMSAFGGAAGGQAALVQWLVDHPMQTDPALLSRLSRVPTYRLVTVADEDLHLVQMRFAGMHRIRLWHGVSREALCEAGTIERSHMEPGVRDVDVLMSGSIADDAEIERLRAVVPSQIHGACMELVHVRLGMPWMSFGQAFDLVMPSSMRCEDLWELMAAVFRYTTALLNRERRVRLVRGLSGIKVTILGVGPWRELCGEHVQVHEPAAYADLPGWMARSKVVLALNPTQFTHAFSERVLLGLAGGAACVTDDRVWIRHEFAGTDGGRGCVALFPAATPPAMRAQVERLLNEPSERARLGSAGRREVEAKHLWTHRLGNLLGILGLSGGR